MANLSQAQIAMYARAAGMPNPDVMSAIAMAESGGNPRAHNAVPPDNSYGLWQINMLGSMGAARRKEFGITSNEQLYDPVINAKAASRILKSQGLKAWSTYTNGAYKKFMGGASGSVSPADWDPFEDWNDPFDLWPDDAGPAPKTPWESLTGETPPESYETATDALSGLTDIAKLGVKAGEWLSSPRNWVNVLYVVSGGVLILASLSATVRQQAISKLSGLGKMKMGKAAG